MDLLEEARVMLDLAIHNLSKAGYDTEHFERTVSKIKAKQQVKNCSIPAVVEQIEQCSGCEESTGETKLWCCNHCGKRIEDLKALRIYAVMCGFITTKQYKAGYERYVKSSTDEEVGTFDWFVEYCKKNKEFRIKHLG